MFSIVNSLLIFAEGGTTTLSITVLHLALALGLGLLSTRLMKVVKLPNVTGYLLVGVLLGPTLLGNVKFGNFSFGLSSADIANLSVFSDIALGFIALTIGTSFKLGTLKKTGKNIIMITVFEGVIAMLLVMLVLILIHLVNHEIVPLPVAFTLGAIASDNWSPSPILTDNHQGGGWSGGRSNSP